MLTASEVVAGSRNCSHRTRVATQWQRFQTLVPPSGTRWIVTYTRTWSGFVYVAFVIDCFSRVLVGWHAATMKQTAMVTTALRMALWRRGHTDRPVHVVRVRRNSCPTVRSADRDPRRIGELGIGDRARRGTGGLPVAVGPWGNLHTLLT